MGHIISGRMENVHDSWPIIPFETGWYESDELPWYLMDSWMSFMGYWIFHGIGHGICHAMYMQGTCKVLQVPSWPSWPSCWIHRSNPLKKPLGIVKLSTPSGDLAAWGKFGDNPRVALLHRQFLGCVRNLGDTLNLLPFSWGKLMLIFPDLFIWRFLGLI